MRYELPRLMGHRGAAALAPENTLAGFAAAKRFGCTWVEFDVMLAGDGVPVLHHDESLGRTARGVGRVAETLLRDLQALDAGSHFSEEFLEARVPSLEEALAALQLLGLHPNVELKPPKGAERATAQATIEVMRRCWPARRRAPLLSAFAPETLEACRELAPDWPRSLLARSLPKRWGSALGRLGCVGLHLDHRRLSRRTVHEVKTADYALAAFTVNDAARARELIDWGVDCIITDAPHVVGPAVADAG